MLNRLRPWHFVSMGILTGIALLFLWFALAYGGLPRLWSHHEHKQIGKRDEIISYTAQDIPGDPVNLRLRGSEAAITTAFQNAGWFVADRVSFWSGLRIGISVLLGRPYPQAPVSPLFVQDAAQDIAFEKEDGRSADKRHHVRLWRVAPNEWLGAATFDRGVGFSLFTLQITHHIGPNVDFERDTVGKLLAACGGGEAGTEASGIPPNQWHRNGGGDKYSTDGKIAVFAIGRPFCHRPATMPA
jgi:hypothetical protein